MVNICESRKRHHENKPKVLKGMNQKVRGQERGLLTPPSRIFAFILGFYLFGEAEACLVLFGISGIVSNGCRLLNGIAEKKSLGWTGEALDRFRQELLTQPPGQGSLYQEVNRLRQMLLMRSENAAN